MSKARRNHLAPRIALLLAAAIALSACGATIGKLPESLGGLPETAPQRPAETMPFPNVYEPRPKREAKPLSDDEQKKLETDLSNLRDSQNQRANPPPPPPPPPPKSKAVTGPVKKEVAKKEGAKAALSAKNVPAKSLPTKKKQDDAVVPEQKGPAAPLKLVN